MKITMLSWTVLSGLGLFALTTPCPSAAGQNLPEEQVGVRSGQAANDAELATEVKSQLADRAPGAADLQVQASRGVVTLSGSADSQAAKRRAMSLVWHIKGVVRIDDHVVVRGSS